MLCTNPRHLKIAFGSTLVSVVLLARQPERPNLIVTLEASRVNTMANPSKPSARVTFHPSTIQFEPKPKRPRKHYAKMTTEIFSEFQSEDTTDAMLAEAAQLFSEHYGVWATPPPGRQGGKPGIAPPPSGHYSVVKSKRPNSLTLGLGTRVKLSGPRLRSQCLPAGARCSYVRVTVDGTLAGNAFACRWEYQGRQVCWVTQLVVHRDYRERRLATRLLEKLRDTDDEIFGIMSSHPAACIAMAKACAGE